MTELGVPMRRQLQLSSREKIKTIRDNLSVSAQGGNLDFHTLFLSSILLDRIKLKQRK